MKNLVLAIVGVSLALAGCAKKAPPPRIVEVPAQSFTRAWTAELQSKHNPVERLYVREDLVFIYTHDRVVYVLDRNGGQLRHADFVVRPGSQLLPPVVLATEIIYPATSTLEVYDRRGSKVRTINVGSPLRSGAIGAGRNIYVGTDASNGGRIAAIDLDRPYDPVRWELMTLGGLSAAPALNAGVLYIGSEDGKVYAVNEDREPVWTDLPGQVFATGGPITGDVKADDTGVYVASHDSKLYVLDNHTGRIKWQYYATTPLSTGPLVTKDIVYLRVPSRGIVALDKLAGDFNRKPKWIVPEATDYLAEDEKFTYLRLRGNILAAADKETGEIKFKSQRTDLDVFGVNTRDNIIYAATTTGEIVAIRPVLKPGTVGELVLERIEKLPLGG